MDTGLSSLDTKSNDWILSILEQAEMLSSVALGETRCEALTGKLLVNLFYEPSTRTRMSFESAMKRLGGGVLNLGEINSTSVAKGESLYDTIRVTDGYGDIIVLRHPMEGAALFADSISSAPVINGGDGSGRHPTQTLLDLATINTAHGRLDVDIVLAGDLRYGRTVHSLARALARFNARIILSNPEPLAIPNEVLLDVKERGGTIEFQHDLSTAVKDADVVYMTRIQRERFPDDDEYEKVAGTFRLHLDDLNQVRPDLIIMHPLPRVDEIDTKIDNTPHAHYFQQSENGVKVRMALLCDLLNITPEVIK